jgi:MoxR-like ATPase
MAELTYQKLFDPARPPKGRPVLPETVVDRASPQTFRFDDDALVLAINIARATGRPLLLRGTSGVGKSSVARAVAWREGWSYAQIIVTSRTLARDFLYQVDELKRLQDAYTGLPIADMQPYLVPGPLFWAFEPDYARSILQSTGRAALVPSGIVANSPNTVVLIDEIDKADPDVPNNLLEPLGRLSFEAAELPRPVIAPPDRTPLVVLTTNEERDLPAAFLRRCIEHLIELPNAEQLRRIGEAHLEKEFNIANHDLVMSLSPGSPAEYLDCLRVCRRLVAAGTTPADLVAIVRAVLGLSAANPGS